MRHLERSHDLSANMWSGGVRLTPPKCNLSNRTLTWAKIHAAWMGLANWPIPQRASFTSSSYKRTGSRPTRPASSDGWRCLTWNDPSSAWALQVITPIKPRSLNRWLENGKLLHPQGHDWANCEPHEWSAHGQTPLKFRRKGLQPSASTWNAFCSWSFKDKARSSSVCQWQSAGMICETLVKSLPGSCVNNSTGPTNGDEMTTHQRDLRDGQASWRSRMTSRTWKPLSTAKLMMRSRTQASDAAPFTHSSTMICARRKWAILSVPGKLCARLSNWPLRSPSSL